MEYSSLLFFLSHILILNFVGLINAQPDFLGYVCGKNVTTASAYEANKNNTHTTPMYEANKNTLLSSLSSNIGRYGFYNSSIGVNSDRVNAIALCRGDVELDTCRSCVNNSAFKLPQVCGNYSEALGWYDYCMIRFSNNTIFHTVNTGPAVYAWNLLNVSNVDKFNEALKTLLDMLKKQASSGDSLLKVATGNISGPDSQTIYALSQCTPDLSKLQCNDCLEEAFGQFPFCCSGKLGGRVLTPSCNFRYEIGRFYNDTPAPPPSSQPSLTPSSSPTLSPPLTPLPPPSGNDNSKARTTNPIIVPTVIAVILTFTFASF